MEGATGSSSGDLRPAIASAGVLLLAIVVGLVLLSKGSSADLGRPAPARCLALWNANPKALRYGSHNFASHSYRGAEVLYVDRDGDAARRGGCAVVFPAVSLDPEPFAAAQAYREGRWVPMSKIAGVEPARLAKLQAEAIRGANAVLHEDGSLASLS